MIANHILVSFHVAFISSVLALPPTEILRGEVLAFIFWSWETLVSALFMGVTFHVGIAVHELGHFLTAARLNALSEEALAEAQQRLAAPAPRRGAYIASTFLRIPFGAASGVRREGLTYYPDAPFNLAVAAAGPRASRNAALAALPPALALLAVGLASDLPAAVYAGRLLLGIGVVTLLDFFLADPGKYAAFTRRERQAREQAKGVARPSGWMRTAPEVKRRMLAGRMQEVTHPSLGPVTAPWQFRNCGMGGRHTEREYPESNISMQEAMFLILCAGDSTEAQELTVRLQNRLKEIIEGERGCRVMGIGLEGGLAPYVDRGDFPLPEVRLWSMMKRAIEEVGCRPGLDVAIALDPALSELEIAYRERFEVPDAVGQYLFWRDKAQVVMDREGVLDVYVRAVEELDIPILSIEDGFSEHDAAGWKLLNERLGDRVFIIGDDLVTTNDRTIETAAGQGLINCALIKANQIGTLYETLLAMLVALGKGLELVVSHRSKSPNDDMEAQIAVAANALGLKAGGGANTERLVKYQSVAELMLKVADAEDRRALRAGERATVSSLRAYEEPTNAGIPTVGVTLGVVLENAGVELSFRGATPLGTSAGTGEAIHLVDSVVERAEHREVVDRFPTLFTETEPGVLRFRPDLTRPRVQEARDPDLARLFERATRYGGKGCLTAADNVTEVIAPLFSGRDLATLTLADCDRALLGLELRLARRRGKIPGDAPAADTVAVMQRKQNLGMNAILSVSLAMARAIARVHGKELYELLREEMLAVVERLCSQHDVQVQGSTFAGYVTALRQVNRRLESAGTPLYEALRVSTGIYDPSRGELGPTAEGIARTAVAGPVTPLPESRDRRPAAVFHPGDTGRAAPTSLLSPPVRLTSDEMARIEILNQLLFTAFGRAEPAGNVTDALRAYLETKHGIARRTGHFGIVFNRLHRSDGRLLVPYIARNSLFLHAVREGSTTPLVTRRFSPGTIFTDALIHGLATLGPDATVVDLEPELYTLDPDRVPEVSVARVRDITALLKRVNDGLNRSEVELLLRTLVARLCHLPVGTYLGAKNLQPEVRGLTGELVRFLNGPHTRRLLSLVRVVVRNLSNVIGRPNLIDRLWNDSVDLAEVHVRGSSIVNELRRSSHHALGWRTLQLAEAYLVYLETGTTEALAQEGFESVAEADELARGHPEPQRILTRVVQDLRRLLGTSETATRIREWREAYDEGLLQCEFGNTLPGELEALVGKGIRARNRWAYAHHLRILARKCDAFAEPADVVQAFRGHLEQLEGLGLEDPSLDLEAVERTARRAVELFVDGVRRAYQTGLFRSLDELVDAHEERRFYDAYVQSRRLRLRLADMVERPGYPEQRHYLYQLDCLIEEMSYLALRHIATVYRERGVRLDQCFEIIRTSVLNLELDGLASRDLLDLANMLVGSPLNDEELLNVLEYIERGYHKKRQLEVAPYERMSERLDLSPRELQTIVANLQRYMHDLNSMVSFADIARSHIGSHVPSEAPARREAPAAVSDRAQPIPVVHLSHREEIVKLVESREPTFSLRDSYGGKGSSLLYIAYVNVPTRDGFILPTDLPRADLHRTDPQRLRREIADHLAILERDIAARSGVPKRFGDPAEPLLLAVRGGSVFSMPGMLTTVVFVGMNDQVAVAMAEDDPWHAYDSYRRFLASYAAAVWGFNFEALSLVDETKRRHGVRYKQDLPWQAMREIAERSCEALRIAGFGAELDRVLHDPSEQLYGAVQAVFASWETDNVARYREIKGLCHSWHTAVIVQEMAFGNRANPETGPGLDETRASLTGVVPRTRPTDLGLRVLEGEFKFSAAGDDLVGGVTSSDSFQSVAELGTLMPRLEQRLTRLAGKLRRFEGTDQEIEFTVDRGVLSVLQARSAQTGTDQPADRFVEPGEVATRGLGIRGGAFRGLAAFDEADLAELRAVAAGDRDDVDGVLMVLENPTPEDIPMILSADGLLTTKGGSTSHAAVAAHGVDDRYFYAVMSAKGLRVDARNHRATIVDDGDLVTHTIGAGDVVSIHGTTGAVYVGTREVERRP